MREVFVMCMLQMVWPELLLKLERSLSASWSLSRYRSAPISIYVHVVMHVLLNHSSDLYVCAIHQDLPKDVYRVLVCLINGCFRLIGSCICFLGPYLGGWFHLDWLKLLALYFSWAWRMSQVIECNEEERRLIVSEKQAVLVESVQQIKEGDVYEGKVNSVTEYGAFVDLKFPDGQSSCFQLTCLWI